MFNWNSKEYLSFKNERTQPAFDLVNRIDIKAPQKIIDIGCGPGNSTAVLKQYFNNAEIIGIDSSEDMIDKAKSEYNDLTFINSDIRDIFINEKESYDVVFSNACIQWIPEHKALIKNMIELLKDNGYLAIQIPYNYDEPIHKIINEVTKSEKWKNLFDNHRERYVLEISEYYDLLSEVSSNFEMWQTIYFHKMKSYDNILEWYRGTGLRPYLEQLNEAQKIDFERDILIKIKQSYPMQKNGEIMFKFPRLFFIAEK